MSTRLQQIKDEYAIKHHAHDWESFIRNQASWWIEAQMNDVCNIYAKECSQASLEKASENAKVEKEYSVKYQDFIPDGIDKESITNPENVILL